MDKLRMLSLCAGIGGGDLAAEATHAIEVVGQVENDVFCQVVLSRHWPDVKRIANIEETTGYEFGAIDIILAGVPCQGNSLAGKRKGAEDERNLWHEAHRIIRAASPAWVVVENVVGLLTVDSGRLFGGILADLDALGYSVGWSVYGAVDVGAPHKRDRVFIVAHANDPRREVSWNISDSSLSEREESKWEQNANRVGRPGSSGAVQQVISRMDAQRSGTVADSCREGLAVGNGSEASTGARAAANRRPGGELESQLGRSPHGISPGLDSHRWPAYRNEPQYAWEPERLIDPKSVPFRKQRIKALGNAIVPQQIYPLFWEIANIENIAP